MKRLITVIVGTAIAGLVLSACAGRTHPKSLSVRKASSATAFASRARNAGGGDRGHTSRALSAAVTKSQTQAEHQLNIAFTGATKAANKWLALPHAVSTGTPGSSGYGYGASGGGYSFDVPGYEQAMRQAWTQAISKDHITAIHVGALSFKIVGAGGMPPSVCTVHQPHPPHPVTVSTLFIYVDATGGLPHAQWSPIATECASISVG
jgi:hypothetical protein